MGKLYEITNQEYQITERGHCAECEKNLPPRKTKYCSKECNDLSIKKSRGSFVNEQKTCVCVRCEKEFQYKKRKSSVYCSKECQTQTAYETNRSDFSIKSITKGLRDDGHKTTSEWMQGGVLLPQPLLDVLEFAPSNAVWEDPQNIDKIISEELPIARYSDGTVYVSEVGYHELRKQKAHEQIMIDKGFGRKARHGERKKFMALVKNQPNTDTSTEN